jgi:N-methylhydantoinase B
VQVHLTNTSNLPIECLEAEYPLLVEEYALAEDSGGAGRCAGGRGIHRTVTALDHEARFLATCERARVAPWGLAGGEAGKPADLTLNPGSAAEQPLPPKVWDQPLGPGDRVRITTAGGGGYGAT